jgi:hypothetical protein
MASGRHHRWYVAIGLALATGQNSPGGTIEFNRDIRPILSQNCLVCHGHDQHNRKAKLRLDVREVAVERGAIVAGKPAESKLVEHIYAENPDDLMPPPETNKSLTPAQKALLKDWIAAGAAYEPHWAYIQPKRPEVPQVKGLSWVRNPIDAFILQGLETRQIQPSPEADKRTLLRRLSLDLIGLPPTPEEVRAFLSDKSPAAYERQVNRLLRSPHFGERMAVPWLDLARYADTVGYHGDQNQNNFPYRDYIIAAFNNNKPFDQFTIEQLAGDLLPAPSSEALIATGFNRQNMMTREGGAQPKEYLAKYAADRVRTVSMTWLGSTMGCAECHDHKYDPFTSKDFYQMEAFFADLKQWGVYGDYAYTPTPELKGYGNDHPFPPEIQVDSPYLQTRIARLQQKVDTIHAAAAAKLKADEQRQAEFEDWCRESRKFLKEWPHGWTTPRPEVTFKLKDTNAFVATNFNISADSTISFTDKPKEGIRVTLPLPPMWVSAIRLEVLPQEVKEEKKASRKKRDGTAISLSLTLKAGGKETRLPLYFGEADQKHERYAMSLPIIGVTDLWQVSTNDEWQAAVWLLDQPVQANVGDVMVVNLGNAAVASARVSVTPFPAAEPLQAGPGLALRTALGHTFGRPTAPERDLLQRTFLMTTRWDTNAVAQARKLEAKIRECRGGHAYTMVSVSREPAVTRVLARGNWQDESGEVVAPATPHFLPQLPNAEHRRLTRLDLAHWLVSPENPLTARAVMNRMWQRFFGTGISAVVDDLGAQGEWPVEPELLDWLACEFMRPELNVEAGRHASPRRPTAARTPRRGVPAQTQRLAPGLPHAWDVKHMVKLMVMSATYRQESNQRPELKDVDPNNRLLACQSPRRLEAEFVRDNALAIAGLLNEDIGGPSAHPYQPPGYYANLQFPDRDYHADMDQRQYRRGVYTHWQRTFLHPMLANFDAPSREECSACRPVSNTPQQALTLLNDPTFVEAARVFAARLLAATCQGDEARLDMAFERALARPARDKEKASLLEFLAQQRDACAADPVEAGKLLHVGNALSPVAAGILPAVEDGILPPGAAQDCPDAGRTRTGIPPGKMPGSTAGRMPTATTELAAWTEVCRVILNLHETITKY